MIRTPQKIKMIKTAEIMPNPYQTRRNFPEKGLSALSESIKQVGILNPVILRGTIKGYEVICGQRRVRAAIMAGIKEVPSIIVRAGDRQCSLLSMAENIHREKLGICEEAEGYFNLFAYHGIKKDKLSSALAVENGKIREKLRVLSLGERVKYKIEENDFPQKVIYELIKLRDEEKQLELIEKLEKDELNYKSLCEEVKETLRQASGKKAAEKEERWIRIHKNLPLYINTVKKTEQMLKNSGARVETVQTEDENHIEFKIKILK